MSSSAAAVTKGKGATADKAASHRVRITLVSRNVAALERVCTALKNKAQTKGVKVSGPVRLPTKTLSITTRRTPCGEGSKSWDRYELNIHKRIIDVQSTSDVVQDITTIEIEPGVHVEVELAR